MTTTESSVLHFALRIGGEDVETDDTFEIRSPATNEIVATTAKGEVEHADAAVAAARASFESGVWAGLTPAERSQIMKDIGDKFGELLDEFVELECLANGATVRQATGFHIGYAAAHWDFFAELAGKFEAEAPARTATWPTLAQSFVRREPIGVCAAVTPFNFPLLLAMWKFAPALAAGNSVVVKPDEKTPLTMIRFAQLAEECGLPPGVLNVVTGTGVDVGARLASHPDVDKIGFTGSTAVGREIARLAAGTVKRVTLELGGKSPVIVLDDADLDTAVDAALFGCFLYSGQICESGTRLLLPDSIHDEFVERMVARTKTIKIGDPFDWDTDLGPVISEAQHTKILGYIKLGQEAGAKVATGGGVPEGDEFKQGWWIEPTILTEVTNDMRVAQEEIFGPVLCVIRYSTVDEALKIANDTEYGLASAVWSGDDERAIEVARGIRAGTVWINDHHMINCQVPFGGYKQSGVGRELGPDALDAYTETKNVHLDLSRQKDRRVYDVLLSHGDDA